MWNIWWNNLTSIRISAQNDTMGCSASKKNKNLGTRFEWYFADCFRIEKYEPSTL